jgi:hypothetical protein
MTKLTRRGVLRGAGAALAPFSRARGANDAVRLAVVGVGSTVKIGGKGKADARDFAKIPGVRVVAFCDVDRANLEPEVRKWRDRGEKVEAYTDVRKLLENREIDAVSVTTPNHWHALVTVWACQAGKDVFVQKPASHTLVEGRRMVEAARKYNRMVQCPSMSREANGFQEAAEWAWKGNLGRIRYIQGVNYGARTSIGKVAGPQPIPSTIDYDLWSGPAPVLPLRRQFLHYDWHWQWPYGDGDLGNWGIHILDGCRMAVRQNGLPRRVMALGGRFAMTTTARRPTARFSTSTTSRRPFCSNCAGGSAKSRCSPPSGTATRTRPWTNIAASARGPSSTAKAATWRTTAPSTPAARSSATSNRLRRTSTPTSSTPCARASARRWRRTFWTATFRFP